MSSACRSWTYDLGWSVAVLLLLGGWVAAFTTFGAVLLYSGTAMTIALFVAKPRPTTLAWMTLVLTVGWFPVFLAAPALIMAPIAAAGLAWLWQQRRRERDHGTSAR